MAINPLTPPIEPAKRPPLSSRRTDFVPACKVALLGFGTVGGALADILCRTPPPQLRLTQVLNRDVHRKRVDWTSVSVDWTDDFDQILASDAEIVVELIGGVHPAKEWIEKALLSGKSVVTANKRVMAEYGPELLALAERMEQRFEYGGSVAGGVPVLCGLQHGLAGDQIVKLCGVLNGTCNYILSNMEAHGTTFASALTKAQRLGFAESDPAEDIHGLDATCKLTILSRLAFRTHLESDEIPSRSIEGITPIDFELAKQLGFTIRQVSSAEVDGNAIRAAVRPALVPLTSPLAQTWDNQNALIVTGRHGGETLFAGLGAGGRPTAVAVLSDLVSIAEGRVAISTRPVVQRRYELSRDFEIPHYVRVPAKSAAALERFMQNRQLQVTASSKQDRKAECALLLSPRKTSEMVAALEAFMRRNKGVRLGSALPIVN